MKSFMASVKGAPYGAFARIGLKFLEELTRDRPPTAAHFEAERKSDTLLLTVPTEWGFSWATLSICAVVRFPLEDDELIENLARFADGTLSEAAVKSRHHLSNEDWAALGESDKLVELVEACKLRRIRTGATKRERAQIEIVDAPPILGGIMRDPNANERHRIDSIKTLDALASTGAEAAAAGARFEITINLGADHIEHYSKSIAIDPDDTNPNSIDTTDVIAAIAMNKSKDGDNGGHL